MIMFQSKWRFLIMFLGIQLVVMALLSREGYQKRVNYFIRIFRKPNSTGLTARNRTVAGIVGGDVYANLSHLPKAHSQDVMPFCPKTSPLIGGPIHVSFPSGLTLEEVQRKNPLVVRGGRYRPPGCEARHRTAIIIPHRNREHHLKFLLYYLHPFLQRQQLNYGIYVIHQAGNYTFNRAKLMNVGFREAMKEEDWDCLFFHDVDLIPEDDRNTYTCDANPKHAAIAMDKFGYKWVGPSSTCSCSCLCGGLTCAAFTFQASLQDVLWRSVCPVAAALPEDERLSQQLLGLGGRGRRHRSQSVSGRDVHHTSVAEGRPLQDDQAQAGQRQRREPEEIQHAGKDASDLEAGRDEHGGVRGGLAGLPAALHQHHCQHRHRGRSAADGENADAHSKGCGESHDQNVG